jgi:hypothetical protein
MYLKKVLESCSLLYCINIRFLLIIFKEDIEMVLFSLQTCVTPNKHVIIAGSSAGEIEDILNSFCQIVFIVRIITICCVW